MNHYEFVCLVAKLREAQKEYYARRTRSALHEAKYLESQVDRYLLTYLNQIPVQAQMGLEDVSGPR